MQINNTINKFFWCLIKAMCVKKLIKAICRNDFEFLWRYSSKWKQDSFQMKNINSLFFRLVIWTNLTFFNFVGNVCNSISQSINSSDAWSKQCVENVLSKQYVEIILRLFLWWYFSKCKQNLIWMKNINSLFFGWYFGQIKI